MFKKIMLLALAVGALVAFAAPAAAQANVQLTDELGALEENDEVEATSTNLVTTLSSGRLECAHVVLHLTVVTNGLEEVVLEQVGEATTAECFINVGIKFPAKITDGTLGVGEGHLITIDTWGEGTTTAHFGADVAALGLACSDDGSVDVLATNETSTLDVLPSVLVGSGSGCGNGTIEGTFELSSANGEVLIEAQNT